MKRFLVILLPLALACLGMTGPKNIEVVMMDFPDYPPAPCADGLIQSVVYEQYADWLLVESRGLEWVTPGSVWGPFTLPQPLSFYGCTAGPEGYPSINACNATLFDHSISVANQYFNVLATGLTVFLYNGNIVGAGAGAPAIYTNCHPPAPNYASLSLLVMIHEGWHAEPERLKHFASWQCPGVDVGPSFVNPREGGCSVWGDKWSPGPTGHFSTYLRWRLGWMQPSNIKLVETSQNVQITRADVQTSEIQEVRIPIGSDSHGDYFYTIEYRVDAGVLIRMAIPFTNYSFEGNETFLVNNEHQDPTNLSGNYAITAANPFVDPYRGIQINFVSADSTSAVIAITTQAGPGGNVPKPPPGKKPLPRDQRSKVR